MYHPEVIAANRKLTEEAYARPLQEHTVEECADWTDRLSDAVDDKGRPTRPLLSEEQAFIANELLFCKISFTHWAQRYAFINIEGRGVDRLYPLLDSQQFILKRIGDLELLGHRNVRNDAILVNVLKATRQIGVSTLAECMLAHRQTTQNNIFGLIASDVPESSAYLFDMLERIVDHLPWWLRPNEIFHVKNAELTFEGGSQIWVGAGKSTRGTTGQRGQLGRGKTLSVIHLSELSTWESPDQIDDALIPTVHRNVRHLGIFESTAKGRGNWWHKHWQFARDSPYSRFTNVFIPWYAEPKYSIPAPPEWSPNTDTLAHARRCVETSTAMIGRQVTPTADQLYWYESTRAYYEGKDNIRQFMEEYGAIDDDECFQYAGTSIFSPQLLAKHQNLMKSPIGAIEITPILKAS